MSSLTLAALTVAAEATPTVITTVNPDGTFRGSPGIVGFGVTFVLAVVIVMLGLDLTRRARRRDGGGAGASTAAFVDETAPEALVSAAEASG